MKQRPIFEAMDDLIDAESHWRDVLAYAFAENTLQHNEKLAFLYWALGFSTNQIARVLERNDGQDGVTRQRATQLVKAAIAKCITHVAGRSCIPQEVLLSTMRDGD